MFLKNKRKDEKNMAKFGGFPGMGGANMNQLLRQAQKM